MALSRIIRNAVLDASRRQAAGDPVTLRDRSFWSDYGLPSMDVRRDVLARANAVNQGAALLGTLSEGRPLSDIYAGTGYPAPPGPADSRQANVHGRLMFRGKRGGITYKSYGQRFSWDSSIEELLADIADTIAEFEAFYGLSNGDIAEGSLSII